MSASLQLEQTGLVSTPEIRAVFNDLAADAYTDDTLKSWIEYAEAASQRFSDPEPEFIEALLVDRGFRFTHQKDRHTTDPKIAGLRKEFRTVYHQSLNENSSRAARRLALIHFAQFAPAMAKGDRKDGPEYTRRDHAVQCLEKNLPFIVDHTGAPDFEQELVKSVQEARAFTDQFKDTVPTELKFESAGLPDNPLIKRAYNLMIQENMGRHVASLDSYITYQVRFARRLYDEGWSKHMEVVAAALLKEVYANSLQEKDLKYNDISDRVAGVLHDELFQPCDPKFAAEAQIIGNLKTVEKLEHLEMLANLESYGKLYVVFPECVNTFDEPIGRAPSTFHATRRAVKDLLETTSSLNDAGKEKLSQLLARTGQIIVEAQAEWDLEKRKAPKAVVPEPA